MSAVVEVGLGGRFDATNVLTPAITAITSIAFDHERHLGHTLSDIAFEKAGIAKRGVPLVIGRMPDEAAARIAEVGAEAGAPLVDAHATTTDRQYPPLKLALPGRHQLENAAVAVAILERWSALVQLHPDRSHRHRPDASASGRRGSNGCALPPDGELLIDAAHNPAGAGALASYLQDTRQRRCRSCLPPWPTRICAGMIDRAGAGGVVVHRHHGAARTRADGGSAGRGDSRASRRHHGRGGRVADAAVTCALDSLASIVTGEPSAAGSIYMIGPLRARLLAGARAHLGCYPRRNSWCESDFSSQRAIVAGHLSARRRRARRALPGWNHESSFRSSGSTPIASA